MREFGWMRWASPAASIASSTKKIERVDLVGQEEEDCYSFKASKLVISFGKMVKKAKEYT